MTAARVCSSGALFTGDLADGIELRVESDLKPGEARRGEVTIANLGPLPASLRLQEEEPASHPEDEAIALGIDEVTDSERRRIHLGRIGSLPKEGTDLGRFLAGESRTYRFTVLRSRGAEPRAFSARARYRWSADQPGSER